MQIVHLDDTNQGLCIGRIGRITSRFESSSPTFIIGFAELEEILIAFPLQELRMVDETLPCTLVLAESVVRPVISLNDIRSRPCAAHFDAEVIVGFSSESASSRVTLEQTLCQSDARRNAILVHLLDCPVLVSVYVRPVSLIRPLRPREEANQKEQEG